VRIRGGPEACISLAAGHNAPVMPRTLILLATLLVLGVVLPYAQVAQHEFVSFDDPGYILHNDWVNQGLDPSALGDAFTQGRMANWHPLTWVSHMVDVSLFGLDPGPHHLMNVALHALNAVLLLLALHALTGSVWRSALVAALFAWHPLRVESVAWASERKDVLSGTFWMLSLLTYARFARQPSGANKAWVLACFALGLLAKPMLVTLPFVLLLLDAWPLRRLRGAAASAPGALPLSTLVREKIPFFVLAALVSAVTVVAQAAGDSVKSTDLTSMQDRLLHAPLAVARYLGKSFWPDDLAFFYPHPAQLGKPFMGAALLSLLALVVLTALFVRARQDRPWLLVGWLWFLGALAPVVGILQVGEQALADRYTYLPGIGLTILVVWQLGQWVERRPASKSALVGLCTLALVALTWRTHVQAATWKDDATLYSHALEVTEDNYVAHTLLGAHELDSQRPARARDQLVSALAIEPLYPRAIYNLGAAHMQLGENAEAEARFREVLALRPAHSEAHNNLAILLANTQRIEEALEHLRQAVASDPGNTAARNNLKNLKAAKRRSDG